MNGEIEKWAASVDKDYLGLLTRFVRKLVDRVFPEDSSFEQFQVDLGRVLLWKRKRVTSRDEIRQFWAVMQVYKARDSSCQKRFKKKRICKGRKY